MDKKNSSLRVRNFSLVSNIDKYGMFFSPKNSNLICNYS